MTVMLIVMMISFYVFDRHVSHFPPAHALHVTLYRATTCLLAPLNWDYTKSKIIDKKSVNANQESVKITK